MMAGSSEEPCPKLTLHDLKRASLRVVGWCWQPLRPLDRLIGMGHQLRNGLQHGIGLALFARVDKLHRIFYAGFRGCLADVAQPPVEREMRVRLRTIGVLIVLFVVRSVRAYLNASIQASARLRLY
jgi:hypothetical protein